MPFIARPAQVHLGQGYGTWEVWANSYANNLELQLPVLQELRRRGDIHGMSCVEKIFSLHEQEVIASYPINGRPVPIGGVVLDIAGYDCRSGKVAIEATVAPETNASNLFRVRLVGGQRFYFVFTVAATVTPLVCKAILPTGADEPGLMSGYLGGPAYIKKLFQA